MSECGKDAKKTEVEIMWTNQHGTGVKTDDMVDSQVILQYMCQDFPEQRFPNGKITSASSDFQLHTIRNGVTKNSTGLFMTDTLKQARVSEELWTSRAILLLSNVLHKGEKQR